MMYKHFSQLLISEFVYDIIVIINITSLMSVSTILDKIIKPEFRMKLNDWENYAKNIDRFGLDCISQIYASKGTKKLRLSIPSVEVRNLSATKSSFFGQTQSPFKPNLTTYSFYHGSSSQPKQVKASIFEFKSLSEMKLARPLTQMTITFIDNWLQLKDLSRYQQAVLNCLRSLNSKLQLTQPNSTEVKTKYDWKNDWKLAKPIRMDKAGEDLFAFKPNLAVIEKQQRKKQQQKQKLKQFYNEEFAQQMKIFKDFKIN